MHSHSVFAISSKNYYYCFMKRYLLFDPSKQTGPNKANLILVEICTKKNQEVYNFHDFKHDILTKEPHFSFLLCLWYNVFQREDYYFSWIKGRY